MTNGYSSFRHRSWTATRTRIYAAMQAMELPLHRRLRFATCGQAVWLEVKAGPPSPSHPIGLAPADEVRVRATYCGDRWCVPCARTRARRRISEVLSLVKHRSLRFVTLTLAHSERPLPDQIDHLYAAYRRLRRSPLWRCRVTAAIAFTEVARSKYDDRWHPHLHVLCTGRYLPHRALSDAWHAATGTSYIVHVQIVTDPQTATRYVVKYVSKPWSPLITRTPALLQELMTALHGRRLMLKTGDWPDVPPRPKPDSTGWTTIIQLDQAVAAAQAGDPYYVSLLRRIHLCSNETSRPPPVTYLTSLGMHDAQPAVAGCTSSTLR